MAQNLKPNRLDNRGGLRENAGRPKAEDPKKSVAFRLTEKEEQQVRQFINDIRNNN